MEYLKPVLAALSAILTGLKKLKGSLSTIGAFLMGRRQGHLEQQSKQMKADQDAVRRSADAGTDADVSDDSLRKSKHNRDNW